MITAQEAKTIAETVNDPHNEELLASVYEFIRERSEKGETFGNTTSLVLNAYVRKELVAKGFKIVTMCGPRCNTTTISWGDA